MAGTIVGNIALGASDWSTWITRQERGERGFLQLSLTNFATTTASTIATGSVMECAGSIYQFTDTAITLATGTASANVSVYFIVIPSAGGTTCTIQMNSVAPVWVDAKQGFYASAASISRVIGGCYIGTALVYYRKWLYEDTALSSFRRYGDGAIEALSALTIVGALGIGGVFPFSRVQVFGSSGTFTVPAGIYRVKVTVIGGGGGGGAGSNLSGGGGGAGGAAIEFITVAPNEQITVTVGAGGAAGAAGGTSSVGVYCSATGGSAGAAGELGLGGAGGAGSGGDINITGDSGTSGTSGGTLALSGAGNGGSSILGGGARGRTSAGNGYTGNAYGGGGGGGKGVSGETGGAGAAGVVFVEY